MPQLSIERQFGEALGQHPLHIFEVSTELIQASEECEWIFFGRRPADNFPQLLFTLGREALKVGLEPRITLGQKIVSSRPARFKRENLATQNNIEGCREVRC